MKCLFDEQVDQNNLSVIEDEEDVHVLTGVLKLFFRELKEPLIPYQLFHKAIKASRKSIESVISYCCYYRVIARLEIEVKDFIGQRETGYYFYCMGVCSSIVKNHE